MPANRESLVTLKVKIHQPKKTNRALINGQKERSRVTLTFPAMG